MKIVYFYLFSIVSLSHFGHLTAEKPNDPPIMFLGNLASDIQIYRESIFDELVKEMANNKKKKQFVPHKPKKDVENEILTQIKTELGEYNLTFGDAYIGKFLRENKHIVAIIVIYQDLEPRIRYYEVK